jgi:hexokinase
LAVDLGGTNLRVCSVQLNGDTTFNLKTSKAAIPKEIMSANSADELFAFIALQIEKFIQTHHEDRFEARIRRRQTVSSPDGYKDEETFKLGFTFSFPVHQTSINRGTLIRWTKGFNIPDAVGKDVCLLLQKQIDILKLPVRVAALVNDTVGTLMSRSYTSPGKSKTLLGAIFGTGTNGAYMEKLSSIKKPLQGKYIASTGEMVVNVEWGAFDNELKTLPTTSYDTAIDKETPNPGMQMFEKQVSGMYLGEILRLVILDMNKAASLFRDDTSRDNDFKSFTQISPDSPLLKENGIDSSILSLAAADNSSALNALRGAITQILKVHAPSSEDAHAVKIVAHAIGRRAARLAAVALGAVVIQSERLGTSVTEPVANLKVDPAEEIKEEDTVDVGVDGSLVEFYPGFEEQIREGLRAINGIGEKGEKRIRIGIAKDGSGVGAALIALVADRIEDKPEAE